MWGSPVLAIAAAPGPAMTVKRNSLSCSQYQSEERWVRLRKRASLSRRRRSAATCSEMSREIAAMIQLEPVLAAVARPQRAGGGAIGDQAVVVALELVAADIDDDLRRAHRQQLAA